MEDEKGIKKKELELKPKKCVDGFEYAEMIEAESSVAEYEKLKPNVAKTYAFELDPFQKQAIVAIVNGHSVFVAAHTSAVKTIIAEYAIAIKVRVT
uniref:Uncharacterized protein n=1 Tax=Panagrolaimus sp. PS1159 TaxID=55785 RepID=A0AC35GN86_9BILA